MSRTPRLPVVSIPTNQVVWSSSIRLSCPTAFASLKFPVVGNRFDSEESNMKERQLQGVES
jgi:hypothetical protein